MNAEWTSAAKGVWFDENFGDDAPEPTPSHVLQWAPRWELTVLLPPWVDPAEAQEALVRCLSNLDLDYILGEGLAPDDTDAMVLDSTCLESSSSMDPVPPAREGAAT